MQQGCGSACLHRPGTTSVQHAGCAQRQQHLAANFTRHNFVLRRTKRPRYQSSLCQNASSSFAQSPSDEPQHSSNTPQRNPPQSASPGKTPAPAPASLGQRVKRFFGGDKFDRKRLQALGLGAVASYGFVSNATYGTGLSVSWISFVKQTGKSPLMAQQWKPFLALYAGFWAAQHFVRPLRFSLALAMAPVFDKFINFVQHKTQFKRQNAFAVYLCLLGSVTSICVFGSIRFFAGPMAFAMG